MPLFLEKTVDEHSPAADTQAKPDQFPAVDLHHDFFDFPVELAAQLA